MSNPILPPDMQFPPLRNTRTSVIVRDNRGNYFYCEDLSADPPVWIPVRRSVYSRAIERGWQEVLITPPADG